MKIGFGVLWKVEINDNVHSLDINTAGEKIRANKIARNAVSEIMEYLVAILLEHFRMGIKTGVAEFGDFLRQKFYPIGRVTEDDGLVDLQFREESMEAVNFLLFFH